jgi:hypothetical protein
LLFAPLPIGHKIAPKEMDMPFAPLPAAHRLRPAEAMDLHFAPLPIAHRISEASIPTLNTQNSIVESVGESPYLNNRKNNQKESMNEKDGNICILFIIYLL